MPNSVATTPTVPGHEVPASVWITKRTFELSLDHVLGLPGPDIDLIATLDRDLAADVLDGLTRLLADRLSAHAHGCAAASNPDIIGLVHEHVCSGCVPHRGLALRLRAARRGGFYLGQMHADPYHWARITGLALAASLAMSEPDPYETLDEFDQLLVETLEADELSA